MPGPWLPTPICPTEEDMKTQRNKCPISNTPFLLRMGQLFFKILISLLVSKIITNNNYQDIRADKLSHHGYEFLSQTSFRGTGTAQKLFLSGVIRMRENADLNNPEYGHFLRSDSGSSKLLKSWPLSYTQQYFCQSLIENIHSPWKMLLFACM